MMLAQPSPEERLVVGQVGVVGRVLPTAVVHDVLVEPPREHAFGPRRLAQRRRWTL